MSEELSEDWILFWSFDFRKLLLAQIIRLLVRNETVYGLNCISSGSDLDG